MATVTLLQTTNMAALTALGSGGGYADLNEIDAYTDLPGAGSVACLGSFTIGNGGLIQGTITDVVIDDADAGAFPNFEISGLSLGVSSVDFTGTLDNLPVFTAILLAGNDTITGTSGNDTILGYQGNDTLIGGPGADTLNGGNDDDTASYRTATSGVFAGLEDANANTGDAAGDRYISIENLEGTPFDDVLYGNGADNRFTGGAGNDTFVGKGGADTFDGGPGSDTVAYDASPVGLRADLLLPATNTGDAAGDVYISIENLDGSGFDDTLYGDNNANVLGGNLYHNTPSGDDHLYGRGGNDTLYGYDGNDVLDGGPGADLMLGGTGDDSYYVDNIGDVVTENPDEGADTIFASIDYTIGTGAPIEFLRANAGAKGLVLTGNAFANTVIGGAGNDTINGGPGSDTIIGGLGADTLTGGAGADIFRLLARTESTVAATGRDTITDFTAGDRIDLHAIDANVGLAGDQAFSFIGTTAFSGVAGQLRYAASGPDTLISGDVNGDKLPDFAILATGAHNFTAPNFIL